MACKTGSVGTYFFTAILSRRWLYLRPHNDPATGHVPVVGGLRCNLRRGQTFLSLLTGPFSVVFLPDEQLLVLEWRAKVDS